MVSNDIENGTIVPLDIEENDLVARIAMEAFCRTDRPPGAAGPGLSQKLREQALPPYR